jgi:hypothetical protein
MKIGGTGRITRFFNAFASPVPVVSQSSPPFLTHFETARHCARRKGHAKTKQHHLVAFKLHTAMGPACGNAPALLPVLSKEYIIESFLQNTIRALFVRLYCLFTSYQSRIRCITYVCHWPTPSASYTPTQATSIPIYIYAQDVHSLVLAILTPGRGGLHRRSVVPST